MDAITALDWQRMFWGEAPFTFALEIMLRVGIILLWTATLLRWIGGRSISQLSIVEFLLVIALGSAVGDSLFYPEVPLLHAMLVILLVVAVDKLVDLAISRWPRAKAVIDGCPVHVVDHGRILVAGVNGQQLGTTEVMEMLRMKGVENLGQVRHAYLEPSGGLSLFKADPTVEGLALVPPPELSPLRPPRPQERPCCANCGALATHPEAKNPCPACGARAWTRANACTPL